jgi:transposase
MVPTLVRTLGVKGHRPIVGSRDCKDVVHAFVSLNVVTGRITSRQCPSETRRRRREGSHKTRRLQAAFARHLRDVARAYPASRHRRVVVVIDNAPWHAGNPIREVLRDHPHLQLYRLPSYSPNLNVVERLWKALRHHATHNRLFDTLSEMCRAIRAGLRYFQSAPRKVRSLVASERRRTGRATSPAP